MWTSSRFALALLLAFLASAALSDGINNPTATTGANGIGGDIGGGINNLGVGGGSVTPPGTCTGTIDLSTGCVQPMLGGL